MNGIEGRPKDRRGLPIPFATSENEEGKPDFTAIDQRKVVACVKNRLCGICGEPLNYWMAFLGGERSAKSRSYVDPPMHEECAEAATRLCPHIARRSPQRATKTKVEGYTPAGFDLDKPDVWVIGITRQCTIEQDGVIRPAPFKRVRTFAYNDRGDLEEK